MTTTLTKLAHAREDCDSCGTSQGYGIARAKVRVIFPSGHQLTFCNHCYNKREPQLLALSVSVEKQEGEGTPWELQGNDR